MSDLFDRQRFNHKFYSDLFTKKSRIANEFATCSSHV